MYTFFSFNNVLVLSIFFFINIIKVVSEVDFFFPFRFLILRLSLFCGSHDLVSFSTRDVPD